MQTTSRLERVSIERPCPKSWSELQGDEKRRYCSTCELHVTNLSALDAGEAEDFLEKSRGRVCVTYLPAAKGGAASRAELLPGHRTRAFLGGLGRAAGFLLGLGLLAIGCRPAAEPIAGGEDPDGLRPDSDPLLGDEDRILGRIGPEPRCVIDDERMLMGEMTLPEPDSPESADPSAQPEISGS